MALTFPRDLPAVDFTLADFYPIDPYSSSRSGDMINVMKRRADAWRLDLITVPLRYGDAAEIEAWFLSLRGGLRSLNFVHPVARWPRKHFRDQTPALTAGNLTAITDGNKLSVAGVHADLRLSLGDLIGVETGALRTMGRVVDFSGAGVTREIEIEPTPKTYAAVVGATVRFASPTLVMRPLRKSFDIKPDGGLFTVSMSFEESRQ